MLRKRARNAKVFEQKAKTKTENDEAKRSVQTDVTHFAGELWVLWQRMTQEGPVQEAAEGARRYTSGRNGSSGCNGESDPIVLVGL